MKAKMMDDTELKLKGIEVLNKALSASDALKFLTLLHHAPTDYLKISKRLYQGQTIDEVFMRAKRHWKE